MLVALASTTARGATLDRAALFLRYAAALPHYEHPQTRVEVAPGRFINVICMGEGSPTVVLNAGGAAWSQTWALVQPEVAKETRACAWDRAGNGFSSGSAEPQDILATERDLERALNGAGVKGPLIFVAHSRGAFEAVLFTDRHPSRVLGMLLVDPSYPGQYEGLRRAAPKLMAWSEISDNKNLEEIRACISALDRVAQTSPPECAKLRPRYPKALLSALSGLTSDPLYWKTYLSDFESNARNSTLAINPSRNYGDMPIVVLEAGKLDLPGASTEALREVPALEAETARGRRAMAGYSTHVTFQPVPDSRHAVQLDRPDVVIDAIRNLIGHPGVARP